MAKETTRREALVDVASAAGLLALAVTSDAYGQAPVPMAKAMAMAGDMQACIEECRASHQVCVETARYCLDTGGGHVASAHLRLLIDCADICQATADAMLRDSVVHKTLCGACADICDRCVESCNTFRTDARMAACAKTCRSCAASCQAMAKR